MNSCGWKPSQVTLHDGRVVMSDSEEWRHETEARHICNIRNIGQRRDLLQMIERKRGPQAVERLKYTIKQIWYAPR